MKKTNMRNADLLPLMSKSKRHFQENSLDGIRGLAVIIVVFGHVSNLDILFFDGIKFSGNSSEQLGVYLFFVLSAFLLTRAFIRMGYEGLASPLSWADYFARRVLRIYPLYMVTLLFVTVGVSVSVPHIFEKFEGFSMGDIWLHITLRSGMAHFWTITTEMKYYFILPIFVCVSVFLLRRNILAILAATLVVSIASSAYAYLYPSDERYSIVRYLPMFLCGSLFAFINEWYQQNAIKLRTGILSVVGIVLCVSVFILMPNVFEKITTMRYVFFSPRLTLIWGMLFGLLIFVVMNEKGILSRIFSCRVVRFMGIISFSVYLWHIFVLEWVVTLSISNLAMMAVFYSVTILLSSITFIVIEQPLARIRLYKHDPASFVPLRLAPLRRKSDEGS
ncbi:MAG: acyltransferase [Nitrospirota bacterium]|nr:acyltransferase [Nitrospirota bacterium]